MYQNYTAFGHRHGYPWGCTISVTAKSLEEAHEIAEEELDEVKNVSGPHQGPTGEPSWPE